MQVAKEFNDPSVALICALFAYGNANLIVRFLEGLDFSLLDAEEEKIRQALSSAYYRFQKAEDTTALFIALRRLRQERALEEIFYEGYRSDHEVLAGISALISSIENAYTHKSRGYRFLLGRVYQKGVHSPIKDGICFFAGWCEKIISIWGCGEVFQLPTY